jgi:DNA-binding NarL/FixJ family response regulator
MSSGPVVFLLSDDLIDTSRIAGTAKARGGRVASFREIRKLIQAAQEHPPASIIVDLHFPGLVLDELARELAGLQPRPLLVGYGSHIDTARLKEARRNGCDVVLPRSQIFEELEERISEWLGLAPGARKP